MADEQALSDLILEDMRVTKYPTKWPKFVSHAYRRLQEMGRAPEYRLMTKAASLPWKEHKSALPAVSTKKKVCKVAMSEEKLVRLIRKAMEAERPTEVVKAIEQGATALTEGITAQEERMTDEQVDDLLEDLYEEMTEMKISDGAGGALPVAVLAPVAASLVSMLGRQLLEKFSKAPTVSAPSAPSEPATEPINRFMGKGKKKAKKAKKAEEPEPLV